MTVKNSPAYFDTQIIAAVKSFIAEDLSRIFRH
jgi:hypothetical protein